MILPLNFQIKPSSPKVWTEIILSTGRNYRVQNNLTPCYIAAK